MELVPQIREETFEGLIVCRRNFQRGENAAEIGAVIPVMEKADIPFAAQGVEELKQRSRPFGKFEAA